MSFFTYRQNNSGGSFYGPHYVIVEADNADEANRIAEQNDVYFNGCMTGSDCSCCGDRWSACFDSDATPEPMIYGDTLARDATVYNGGYSDNDGVLIVRKDRSNERNRTAELLAENGFGDAAAFLRDQS